MEENYYAIKSVKCTVDLGCRIDIRYIARQGLNTYMPSGANYVEMKLKKSKDSCAKFYRNGKMECFFNGSITIKGFREIVRRYARTAHQLEHPRIKLLSPRYKIYIYLKKSLNLLNLSIQDSSISSKPEVATFAQIRDKYAQAKIVGRAR